MSDGLFSDADLDLENMIKERASKPAEKKKEDKEEKATEGPFDKRLYIIDGYSVIYRNYFAHLSNPLTDKNGNNISAYFGFFSTLFSLMSAYKMDYLAVVMDERTPTFRKEMYPEYKANRDKAPEDLHAQVPMIKSTLEKIGIACLSNPGFEADDIIATLVEMATRQGMETVMVTGDKDLLQLVGRHLLDHGPGLLGQRRVVPGRRARQAVRQIDGVHRPAGLEQFGHRVLAPDQGVGCLFGVRVLRAGLPLRFAVIFHAVPPSAPVL